MTREIIESFCQAFLSAYLTWDDLNRMVSLKLGKPLSHFTASGMQPVVVANLIHQADASGELEELLRGAYADKPQNPKLRELYWSYFKANPDAGPPENGAGPVAGSPVAKGRRLRLVYCHAPKDSAHAAALERHLTDLVRNGLLEQPWSEAWIRPGQVRQREIEIAWNEADLIVLLISADFLYANDEDLQRAERRRLAGASVIPVIVRPVAWQDSSIGALEAFPRGDDGVVKPVSKWSEQEEAWLSVRAGIRSEINARAGASKDRPR